MLKLGTCIDVGMTLLGVFTIICHWVRRICPDQRGVLIAGVYTNTVLEEEKCVLFREMTLIQECPLREVPLYLLYIYISSMLLINNLATET